MRIIAGGSGCQSRQRCIRGDMVMIEEVKNIWLHTQPFYFFCLYSI